MNVRMLNFFKSSFGTQMQYMASGIRQRKGEIMNEPLSLIKTKKQEKDA